MTLLIEIFKISMKTPGKLLNLVGVVLPRWLNFLGDFSWIISSVTMQKGESQGGCFKKTNCSQIFRKRNISYPLIRTRTCVSVGEKCLFFGKFGVLCFFFLKKPVLRFAVLPYYRPTTMTKIKNRTK